MLTKGIVKTSRPYWPSLAMDSQVGGRMEVDWKDWIDWTKTDSGVVVERRREHHHRRYEWIHQDTHQPTRPDWLKDRWLVGGKWKRDSPCLAAVRAASPPLFTTPTRSAPLNTRGDNDHHTLRSPACGKGVSRAIRNITLCIDCGQTDPNLTSSSKSSPTDPPG